MTIREFEFFAVAAALGAMWSQIRAWLAWPVSLLIVSRQVDSYSSGSVLSYLQSHAKWEPMNGNYYSSEKCYVRPVSRVMRVWYEALAGARQTFWLRRRPIWYSPTESTANPDGSKSVSECRFSYLRWSLDWEKLLADSAGYEEEANREAGSEQRRRFAIRIHGYQSTESAMVGTSGTTPPPPKSTPNGFGFSASYGQRLLHWQIADLVDREPLTIDRMSIRPEVAPALDRIRQWTESKEWCEERGVPWRLGLLLHGQPGTGKTSLARGLAIEHNMPVHVFDVSSLDNYSMRTAWSQMLEDAPCMALLEDIDAVFDGRTPVRKDCELTYDCLLNCIAGVQSADGVLLVVTSNNIKAIDAALLRRGRLDIHVEVLGLDAAGRFKMAQRILGDATAARAAADDPAHAALSPAEFQELLCQRALAERFGDAA